MHQVKTHQRLLMKNNPNSSKMCTEHHTSLDTQQLAGWLLSARFARIASSTRHTASSMRHPASSHGAGNAEVADKLESQADDEVPDVAGDLGASNECTPQDDDDQGVEDVTDVAKSAHPKEKVWGYDVQQIIKIKVFIKCKILSVESILGAHAHAHTPTHTHMHTQHTSILTIQNLIYTQHRQQGLEAEEDSSMERKTWQVYSFGKRKVLRFDLNEPREGSCQRGRGRSFHAEGPRQKRHRNQQWNIWSKESGGWEYQKQSRECGRVRKGEDSHRDKTGQCA